MGVDGKTTEKSNEVMETNSGVQSPLTGRKKMGRQVDGCKTVGRLLATQVFVLLLLLKHSSVFYKLFNV